MEVGLFQFLGGLVCSVFVLVFVIGGPFAQMWDSYVVNGPQEEFGKRARFMLSILLALGATLVFTVAGVFHYQSVRLTFLEKKDSWTSAETSPEDGSLVEESAEPVLEVSTEDSSEPSTSGEPPEEQSLLQRFWPRS